MKKIMILVLSVFISTILFGCQNEEKNTNKISVAVSIVPQEAFVKEVAGDLVDVVVLIPPGNSPANYQPTPATMSKFFDSDIYFSIGVPTESANIFPNLLEDNSTIKVVKLDDVTSQVYPPRYFGEEEHHTHDDNHNNDDENNHANEDRRRDPHIWLSIRRVIVMVETIKDELIDIDPSNKKIYEDNAQDFIQRLNTLDQKITEQISSIENRKFIIFHPSMGYFADDYSLTMIPLELDGKASTARRLENVIDYAKEHDIRVVFYQAEFDSQQAQTVADEINGSIMEIKPLSNDYINNMEDILKAFLRALE